jgi:hypothetical protein
VKGRATEKEGRTTEEKAKGSRECGRGEKQTNAVQFSGISDLPVHCRK